MSDKHKPWHDAHRQKSRDNRPEAKAADRGGDKPRYSKKRDRQMDTYQDEDRNNGKPSAR